MHLYTVSFQGDYSHAELRQLGEYYCRSRRHLFAAYRFSGRVEQVYYIPNHIYKTESEDLDTCFLLTGKPRVGKSTAIKRIIQQIGRKYFGGFYTEEIRNSSDRTGFNCVTLDGEIRRIASVDSESSVRVGRYGVEIEAFENTALAAVRKSLETKKVTVIDEIGFMQMLSSSFEKMVYEAILSSRNIILGTISLDNHPNIDKIRTLPGIRIYHLNEANREFKTEIIARDLVK